MIQQTLEQIAVGDIIPSPDNKRQKIDEKGASFKALTDSIKAEGLEQPVIVRPHPKKKGKYELRAGERRWRACRAAGLETITALVRKGQNDREAVRLTLTENLHREDLEPIEQAEQIALTLDRYGGDAKRMAAETGLAEKAIRVRAHIVGHLAPCWKALFARRDKYPMFEAWTVTHLSLLSRLPEHIQKALYDDFKGNWAERAFNNAWGCSTRDLETIIAKALHLLSKAQWALEDQTLVPKAGACTVCPKRSGHQPALWFDMDDQAKSGDQCLDGFCWQAKEEAWIKRQASELRRQHEGLIYIVAGYPDYEQGERLHKAFGSFLDKWGYKTVSKSTAGAVPAMYIAGAGAGKLIYVKPTSQERSAGRERSKGKPTPLKERQAMLEGRRWAQVLLDLKENVKASTITSLTYKDSMTAVMALAAGLGNRALSRSYAYGEKEQISEIKIHALAKTKSQETALNLLWDSLKPTLEDALSWNGPVSQMRKECRDDATWIAKLIGVDIDALFKDVSQRKGFMVPKAWADLNADGTPKKAKTEKAKTGKKAVSKKAKVKAEGL